MISVLRRKNFIWMGARDTQLTKRKGREHTRAKFALIFLVLIVSVFQSHPFTNVGTCSKPLYGANVAVLLYGQARTLNRTHCSISEHILAPLLNASHKVHVFVVGELDGDSWQYEAYLDQISKRGIRYHIEMQEVHLGATQCARALDEKYEKRMQRLVKEGNLYAAEYLTHLKYREWHLTWSFLLDQTSCTQVHCSHCVYLTKMLFMFLLGNRMVGSMTDSSFQGAAQRLITTWVFTRPCVLKDLSRNFLVDGRE